MHPQVQDPLLRLAVQRGALSAHLAERCAAEARRSGRPPRALLLEHRVLALAVVEALEAELTQAGARTLVPGPEVAGQPPPGDVTWMPYQPPQPGAETTNGADAATRAGTSQPAAGGGEPARLGERLGDDFVLVERLGAGGMGVVYRVRQLSLQRDVALKLLPPAGRGDATGRFMREASAATRVQHPHVVSTFAAGADPASGRLFIVMELMRGGDAEGLLASAGGRLPEARALEVVRDCARGLTALEEAGLVHRDIKPANVFLTPEGTAKLGDLGLARLQSGDDRLTATGTVVGTPCFMSPEQALGETDLDTRSDVYALGALLMCLVSGERPFAGGSVPRILSRIVNEPPPDLRQLVPGVTPATAALVKRAMSKAREERPPGAAALLTEVEAALLAARAQPPGASQVAARKEPAPAPGKRGLVAALVGLLALIALGVGLALVWR